jgi:uncharacterized protein (TIGR00251 family)
VSADGLIATGADGRPVLAVHVQPGASRQGVTGRHGDALKLRVAAPATSGRANRAAQDLLARTFGVPRAAVELVAGAGHRQKRFRFTTLTPGELARRLTAVLGE